MELLKFLNQSFDQIFLAPDSIETAIGRRALEVFGARVEIRDPASDSADLEGRMTATQFAKSKRSLLIRRYPGQFFKRCPGATQKKVLNCCNYYVLNLGQQCNFNCSYCYLQSYLNTPYLQIYSNLEDALVELDQMAEKHFDLPYRVGTGEVIDSLSLDPFTLYSQRLIQFFQKYPRWTLEFKTKSANVDQFLDCDHVGNIVVSWSLNPEAIVNHEEHGTASLTERLRAAEKCRDRGYQIAFHLDPLIAIPDWKDHYAKLVRAITSRFSPKDVSVVSVGTLRFQPRQRHMMRERFGMQSWVVQSEMFPSDSGKLRYDFSLRQAMYQFIREEFRAVDEKYRMFLCMETPETWIAQYDKTPMHQPELRELFRPLPQLSGK